MGRVGGRMFQAKGAAGTKAKEQIGAGIFGDEKVTQRVWLWGRLTGTTTQG